MKLRAILTVFIVGVADLVYANSTEVPWQQETLDAAQNDAEPGYLKDLSSGLKPIVKNFSAAKIENIKSREELTKHAYGLVFTMRALYYVALDAAGHAGMAAAKDAAARCSEMLAAANFAPWIAQFVAANPAARAVDPAPFLDGAKSALIHTMSTAALYASKDAALNTALIAAWNASRTAFLGATDFAPGAAAASAAFLAVRGTAREPARETAYNATMAAVLEATKIDTPRTIDTQKIGKLAYRVAEKIVLQYLLDNAQEMIKTGYDAAMANMTAAPTASIFESEANWAAFKTEHFGKLTPDQIHFLTHWLDELDRVAGKIAGVQK